MPAYFAYPGGAEATDAGDGGLGLLHTCGRRGWTSLRRHSHLEQVAAGQAVIRCGDTDRTLFVVLDGAFAVAGPRRRRTTYRPGDVFGELTFFDGLPQPADVVATETAHVLRIRHDSFDVLAAQDPKLARHLLMDLGRALAARARAAAKG